MALQAVVNQLLASTELQSRLRLSQTLDGADEDADVELTYILGEIVNWNQAVLMRP